MAESIQKKVYTFGESDFLMNDFNAEAFLAKYSSKCNLEDLKEDLTEFLASCDNAITSIMNKDYESFISLSIRLNGLKEKLQKIKSPLDDSSDLLKQHKENLIHECESLYNLLRRHKELETKKKHLSQFLAINTIITTSEQILKEVNSKPIAQFDMEDIMKVERLCRNVTHINHIISSYKYNDFSFLIICKDRNDLIRKACISIIQSLFDRTVQGNSNNRNLTIILKCYVILDMVDEIEVYYRENFIIPFIEPIITRERLDGNTRNSCSGLPILLETLYNYIANNCLSIIYSSNEIIVLDEDHHQHCVYDFFIRCIWSPIVDFFFRRINTIFVCGSHAIFQKNYLLCDSFVKRLSLFCPNQTYFWKHPQTLAFYNKWEISFQSSLSHILFLHSYLTVYATSLSLDLMTSQISILLKQQQQTQQQEEKETTSSIQQKKQQEIPFLYESATITYSLITYIYSDSIYLSKCNTSLLQLALALLKRYYVYINATLENLSLPTKESLFSMNLSPQPSTPSPTVSYSVDDSIVSLLSSFIHDLILLHQSLLSFFQTQLQLSSISSHEKELILSAFQYCINHEGTQQINQLYHSLLLINLYHVSTSLSNARSVTSSYRMTNKPTPSSPSFYVSRILYSYENFSKKYSSYFDVDKDHFTQWKEDLMNEVCILFKDIIEDILKTISRMEEVLSKHRKRTSLSSQLDGMDETDEDKMKHQLLLDVTALKSNITDLGIAIPSSYSDLFAMTYNAYSQKK